MLCLRAVSDQVASSVQRSSAENQDLLKGIMRANLESHDILSAIQQKISPQLSVVNESNIKFTDALGRYEELPYQYFRTWSVGQGGFHKSGTF